MSLTAEDKHFVESLFLALSKRIDDVVVRLDGFDRRFEAVDGSCENVYRRLEETETRLLTEFQKWATPTSARINSHSANLRSLDLELEALRGRVDSLEGSRPH